MQNILNVLAVWVSATTGLPEAPTPPQVDLLPPAEIAALHFGAQPSTSAEDIMAVYLPDSATIVLRPDWDSRDPADVSILVHELVHHMQHAAGRSFNCPEEAEAAAYQAQEIWLAAFDLDLESAFGLDDFSVMMKSSCLYY